MSSVFDRFLVLRAKDLKRIAGHTRGEYQLLDVINEAWLLSHDLGVGGSFNFLDPAAQDLLLSHLYQKLVRYTEQHMRRAIRLDAVWHNGDGEERKNPLMETLVNADDRTPLDRLIEQEVWVNEDAEVDARGCLASAYVHLLCHFNNRMSLVAEYLLISVSHAYRCCARARMLATWQKPIPILSGDKPFMPGPWRRFRLRRPPVQLVLDFGEAALWEYGRENLPEAM